MAALNDAGWADVAVCDFLGSDGKWRNLAKQQPYDVMGMKPNLEYLNTPVQIRNSYQYFMEASVEGAGYNGGFPSPEDGVGAYVQEFLNRPDCYR